MKQSDKDFKFIPAMLAIPLYTVLFIWFVFWMDIRFNAHLYRYGILPRTFKGLRGILFSPFIHGDIRHLYQNSIPLFVLLFTTFYFYWNISFRIILTGIFFTGFLTWIIARPSYHIGASGLIYMLFSFIFFSGVFRKYYRLLAISLMVIFLYGSMVWYMLPIEDHISWEGHVSGFVTGLALAFFYRKTGPQKTQYKWEKEDYEPDEFDRFFDEDGNIIYNPETENPDKMPPDSKASL